MKKLFIWVRKGKTKVIDMQGHDLLEIKYFLHVSAGGKLKIINLPKTLPVKIMVYGGMTIQGDIAMLRIGWKEEDLQPAEIKIIEN